MRCRDASPPPRVPAVDAAAAADADEGTDSSMDEGYNASGRLRKKVQNS